MNLYVESSAVLAWLFGEARGADVAGALGAARLLTSSEIRRIRIDLGMSQEEFATYLSVGVASVKRWELGKAQEKSMDDLVRIKCSLPSARRNVARLMALKRSHRTDGGGRPDTLGRKSGRLAI